MPYKPKQQNIKKLKIYLAKIKHDNKRSDRGKHN